MPPGDPETVRRAEVMDQLLACYAEEGEERRLIRANGAPVSAPIREQLLAELRAWVAKEGTRERSHRNRQERPSISAQSYMILRAPAEFEAKMTSRKGSRKAKVAKAKYLLRRHFS